MAVPTNNAPSVKVLVTRPSHQAGNLCAELTAKGLHAIRYPTIEIRAVENVSHATAALQGITDSDNIIFVSANAVTQANRLLNKQWPVINGTVVAIGPNTANALLSIGLKPNITAQKPFNSEQLLEQLTRAGKTSIIKGEGGRDFLEKELVARGIKVMTIDVYKRAIPTNNPKLSDNAFHYISITSQLALSNLFSLLPEQASELKQTSTFVVFSQRIADVAKQLGCQNILISAEASDTGLVNAIIEAEKR